MKHDMELTPSPCRADDMVEMLSMQILVQLIQVIDRQSFAEAFLEQCILPPKE